MNNIIALCIDLIKNMALVMVLAYVLTRTGAYAAIMAKKKVTPAQQAGMILIFGLFSMYGTLSGIDFMGAIANIRDLGPAIGGLIGGPLVGLGAALIGGLHRFSLGGITCIPCSISTILAGLAGGLIYKYRKGEFPGIAGAVIFMALMESFHMGLNLLIVKPFHQILPIISSISLPMISTNALGMGIFAFILHNLIRERETQRSKELIESELNVAREIQLGIVPKIFPPYPERAELDIFALLEPAREVGGDLYDFFMLDDNHLCFTIGDVSGKGVPASLYMAVTKTLIKAKAESGLDPGEILARVNRELCEDNDSGMFVTGFLGILDLSGGGLTFSNGGHTPPYIHRDGKEPELLPKVPGMALGVMEDAAYTSAQLELQPGDSLIMYTDGVTEAMNPGGELLDSKGLETILRGLNGKRAREAVEHIRDRTRQFIGSAEQADDITILVVKYLGSQRMELRLKNRLEEIEPLARAVENFAAANDLPPGPIFQVNLALDELLTNTISYGFPEGGEHEITVEIALQGGKVVITTRDSGVAFNPLEQAAADRTLDIDKRPIGGLGIHLVRNMMEHMEYRREAGENILTMKKTVQGKEEIG